MFIIYCESNAFTQPATLGRAKRLTEFLASELSVPVRDLCQAIGEYWRVPEIAPQQPNNLVGHAFRSIIAFALQKYGSNRISYSKRLIPT